MYRALARIGRKLAEELQIATLPSSYTLAHSSVLRVEMLRALGETQWHHIASIVKGFLWDEGRGREIEYWYLSIN